MPQPIIITDMLSIPQRYRPYRLNHFSVLYTQGNTTMIHCEGCGHRIHEQATACPNCGLLHAVDRPHEPGLGMGIFALVLSICLIPILITTIFGFVVDQHMLCAVSFALYMLIFIGDTILVTYNLCNKKAGRAINIAALVMLSYHLFPIVFITESI